MKLNSLHVHTSEFLNVNSLVWFLCAAVLGAVDFTSRVVCFSHCAVTGGKYFGLHPFKNLYFAFSIPLPSVLMYAVYSAVLVILCAYICVQWSAFSFYAKLAWVLIFTGALVNVGERVAIGYVRDFIQIGTGYLNLGDIYIILGVAYLLYHSSRYAQRNA